MGPPQDRPPVFAEQCSRNRSFDSEHGDNARSRQKRLVESAKLLKAAVEEGCSEDTVAWQLEVMGVVWKECFTSDSSGDRMEMDCETNFQEIYRRKWYVEKH